MGRNGLIVSAGNGQPFSRASIKGTWREEKIPDVDTYGELFRIRSIAGSVYACGQSCQIYATQGDGWKHADAGILDPEGETLEDIDGSAPDDLYAVGLSGYIAHYDGRYWQAIDSPTDQHLSNVRCVSRDEVYLCGNNGSIFRGNRAGWTSIGDAAVDGTYWGMEFFQGELYLAHSGGIVKWDGRSLKPVPIRVGRKRKFTFHRLHARDGILFSFGTDHTLYFDGDTWKEIVWVDN